MGPEALAGSSTEMRSNAVRKALVRVVIRPSCILWAPPALAHGEASPAPSWRLDAWEVPVVVLLVAGGALYLRGLHRLRRRGGGRPGVKGWRTASFAAGWTAAAAAVLPPVDRWSDVLFSVHMVQHELIMLVAAPLVVLGRPAAVGLWSLGPSRRLRVAAALRRPAAQRLWRALTGRLTVWLVYAGVLWAWHVPALFEAALRSEAIHLVQHLSFFAAAVLFWHVLVQGRYGRLGYGVAVLFLFATALQGGALGALLTVSPGAWYETHAARTAALGSDPLGDQQLAGVLMWIPSGFLLLAVALALFAAWLGVAGRRADGREARDPASHLPSLR